MGSVTDRRDEHLVSIIITFYEWKCVLLVGMRRGKGSDCTIVWTGTKRRFRIEWYTLVTSFGNQNPVVCETNRGVERCERIQVENCSESHAGLWIPVTSFKNGEGITRLYAKRIQGTNVSGPTRDLRHRRLFDNAGKIELKALRLELC